MTEPIYAAEPIDSPQARALIAALWADLRERYLGIPDVGDETDERFGLEPYLADVGHADTTAPHGTFIVGRVGGHPVACGALRSADVPGIGEIKRMYVVPSARGKGLSRVVLAQLEAEAERLGYAQLRLETGIKQPEAMALYESAGWAPIEKYPPWTAIDWSRCYGKAIGPVDS